MRAALLSSRPCPKLRPSIEHGTDVDWGNLREQVRIVWQLARDKPVEICLSGDHEAKRVFHILNGRHERYPFLTKKTFGVALLAVPEASENPFPGKRFENFRRRRRRALDRGYRFSAFAGAKFADGILAIHRSAAVRQGLPMAADYLDVEQVRRYCARPGSFFGVFDGGGVLRAYCRTVDLGGVTHLARIMGEHGCLEDGVMYLLIWELALHIARTRSGHWLEYGSYIGGGKGLRTFKQVCGFLPYRVTWRWTGDAT